MEVSIPFSRKPYIYLPSCNTDLCTTPYMVLLSSCSGMGAGHQGLVFSVSGLGVRVPLDAAPVPGRTYTSHPSPSILHPTPYTLHPKPYTLHPTPFTLNPTPYTLQPSPYTLHPTPYTLHPTPYTIHHTPYTYTIHPTAYTLHPTPHTHLPRVLQDRPIHLGVRGV